mgnify:CR=1 FL=1
MGNSCLICQYCLEIDIFYLARYYLSIYNPNIKYLDRSIEMGHLADHYATLNYWDRMFTEDSLRVGDFQIANGGKNTWAARHINSDTPADLFDSQQEAVNFAVNHAVFFQIEVYTGS